MKKQSLTTSWRAVHSAGPSRRQLIKPTPEVAGLGARRSAPRGVTWGEASAAEPPLPQRCQRRQPTAACTWSLRDEAAWRACSLGRRAGRRGGRPKYFSEQQQCMDSAPGRGNRGDGPSEGQSASEESVVAVTRALLWGQVAGPVGGHGPWLLTNTLD